MSTITFDQAINTVDQLPVDQQEMLIDIFRKRLIEAERHKTAHDARESLIVFHQGQLAEQIMQEFDEGDTVISSEITNKSPFDVDGIDVGLTSKEIVAFVHESRGYR